ncbi:MAG TPA: GH25 family lysozyme [Anaerolineae bacterium]|nr:GH25 family lysozyme [Anaerolineae bacterium]HUW95978.1 GH25 family lysozyme [Anaerolineae bacterium]
MRGIDVSVYSGEITIDQWRKVKADGYGLAVVGLFHGRTVNRYAGQQLGAAIQAGLNVAAYVLIAPWTGWNAAQQVAAGLAEAQVYRSSLWFVAVDVEIDGVTGKMVREALDAVKEMGHRPIIYTGGWWWQNRFNFSDYPLWAAQYPAFLTDEPENLLHTVKLFGGWTREKLVGWQYKGTTDLHGVNCDLNWFDETFVKSQEKEVIEDQFAQLRATEMHLMNLADVAHGVTLATQMRMISAIRHNEGESPGEEEGQWGCLARAYCAEIKAIEEARKRCTWMGRPG